MATDPGVVAKIVEAPLLLDFYKYPAELWVHPRAANPIGRYSRPCARRPK